MDIFQHPYYRLNKIMMTCIGEWPDQSTRTRRCCRIALIYFFVSEIISRIRTICNHHDDADVVMEIVLLIFILILEITFFITCILNSQKTLKLLNRIRTDWQVWAREREVNILHEYTELGKNINIALAVTLYSGFILIGGEPVMEKIIDILLKNGTKPGKFILLVDYYHVNEQKYYFYVSIYFAVMCLEVTAPAITQVIMLISYTQHGNAIFAALRHRLEYIDRKDISVETENVSCAVDDRKMIQLAWCIDRHNDAIEYGNLIEATYTWSLFINTGIGMIVINVVGLKLNNLQVILTCGGYASVIGLCFLMICVASQSLIDHSISIRVYIYHSQWYRLTPKAQKLLQHMMLRCNVPCKLTAGNMLIMSIRTVWLMIKTFVSYFTFVCSMQGL